MLSTKLMKSGYVLLVTGLLIGCSTGNEMNNNEDSLAETTDSTDNEEKNEENFSDTVVNEGIPIDGGTIKVGYAGDSAFSGTLNAIFNVTDEVKLLHPFAGTLLTHDDQYRLVGGEEFGTAANVTFNQEEKSATVTVREGVKWHDGELLTADDLLFSYEIIADPQYTGAHYGESFTNIEGMEAYHQGEADTISGLQLSEDKMSLTIQFNEFNPSVFLADGGIFTTPAPRHYLEDVPIDQLEGSDKLRKNPIGFGPFKVVRTSDNAVEYEAFDDYYLGRPKVDGMIIERVSTVQAVQSLRNGQFDWIENMPITDYDSFKDGIDGYDILGKLVNKYDYIGFRMGSWDEEQGRVDYDSNSKLADKSLRQAMAYALDLDEVGQSIYNGLRKRATSHIVPNFSEVFNDELEGYPYNPEKANKLLDEAGYEWPEGEDYRLNKDGSPLEITYSARGGTEIAELLAQHYLQRWKEIGLNVKLRNGRLFETNSFYEELTSDSPHMEVFEGTWGTGSDPNPQRFYSPISTYNFTRYESEENNELLDTLSSDKALDDDYRIKQYHEWQEFFIKEIPMIPTFWRTELAAVNKRVSAYSHVYRSDNPSDYKTFGLHQIELLAEEPITE